MITNTTQLREHLIADYLDLKTGVIGRAEARARAQLAKQVIDTCKIELMQAALSSPGIHRLPIQPFPLAQIAPPETLCD